MTSGELLMQFYVGGSKFLNETFKKMPVLELLSYAQSGIINVIVKLEPAFNVEETKDQWE